MITKIEFQNFIKEFLFKNDELKKLSSSISILHLSKNYFICRQGNKTFELILDTDESDNLIINYKGKIYTVKVSKSFTDNGPQLRKDVKAELLIKSPMPGLISKVKVSIGDKVKKGTGLLTIEAMKMENEIKSPANGVVENIKVSPGVVVEKNTVLVVIKTES